MALRQATPEEVARIRARQQPQESGAIHSDYPALRLIKAADPSKVIQKKETFKGNSFTQAMENYRPDYIKKGEGSGVGGKRTAGDIYNNVATAIEDVGVGTFKGLARTPVKLVQALTPDKAFSADSVFNSESDRAKAFGSATKGKTGAQKLGATGVDIGTLLAPVGAAGKAVGTAVEAIPEVAQAVKTIGTAGKLARFAPRAAQAVTEGVVGDAAVSGKVDPVTSIGIGVGLPAVTGLIKGAPAVGKGVKKAIDLASGKSSGTVDEVLDFIKPELSNRKAAEAISSGRGTVNKGSLFDTVEVTPDARVRRAAEAVKGIVNPNGTFTEAINNVRSAISDEAEKLKSAIKGVDKAYDREALLNKLKSIEKPILLRSDPTLSNAYDLTLERFMQVADSKQPNVSSLLDARKEFDALVEQELPKLYDEGKPTPLGTSIIRTRSAINDFIESQLPKNLSFRNSLRKQSSMYDAIDALESRAGKEAGTSSNRITRKIRDIIKKNPKAAKAAGYAASGLGGAGLFGLLRD